ncbi:helix-turn-helix domain-containing protein [Luteipulveratus mongoliensis]|uniref:HTH cro/C1-type domain-containing protein n=1 Tax=Luteipulveratus mongoliensis TaxID=571913 RepID=A0A0K1JPD1_9MICO|nr:helix-turn-helix transcriptional regulator [Luteipulveratus mongoliensis]AKU18577.1 hypothetical protein VV02_02535 [Luteipulveratus mongoliensis]
MSNANTLGAFLRSRRDATSPADVGLPPGVRRRAPGLRRAELAMLAGISVDYLVRLEQGRDQHPSSQVLGALGDALQLSIDERVHLKRLAKVSSGECQFSEPETAEPNRKVRPTVRALLRQFEPGIALVVNMVGEVLAFTSGYDRLARDTGILDPDVPSLPRFVFTDTRAREVYADWDAVADHHVATLLSWPPDPHVRDLIDDLTSLAGATFSEHLERHPVPRGTGVERWAHPTVGELRLSYESLELPVADGQRLLVYLPADEATAEAIGRLQRGRPGRLRAVSS